MESAINALVKVQDCLNEKLRHLEANNSWLETEVYDLQDKLKQTELDLHTATVRIETLEEDRSSWDHLYTVPMARRPASKPKAAAGQPKAPVNKPKPDQHGPWEDYQHSVDSPKDR